MSGQILNRINFFLGGIILFSLLLFPNLRISQSLPAFQLIDFLLPYVFIVLFVQRKLVRWQLIYKLLIVFVIYILIVIIVNERQKEIRDYFELYKLLKFGAVIILFTLIDFKIFFKFLVKPIFILVVIGNLIHYFELFGLNAILDNHYNGGLHIKFFGLNSLGEPDLKRMVGFAGSPNINAIIFGFFSILFLPKTKNKKSQFLFFFIAIFMFFLCQSRTNFIALIIVLLFLFLLKRDQFKFNLLILGVVLLSFLASLVLSSNSYINLLFDREIVRNNSLLGRIEVWKLLWEMIKEKPIFGHAPYKEFFYERELYVENEYILQTWRYGFVGLFVFLGIIFSSVFSALKNKYKEFSFQIILITIFIGINGLTNVPFTSPIINSLFAIFIGFYLGTPKSKPTL